MKRNRERQCGFTLYGWDGDTLAWESRIADEEGLGARTTHYVYEPGSFVPLAQAVREDTLALLDEPVYGDYYRQDEDPLWLPPPPAPPIDRVAWYQCDHLGTPQEVTDEKGEIAWAAEYRAWGVAREAIRKASGPAPVTNPIRFQGQYHDLETGLHYNRYRYYDPEVGRFISKDPIGLAGSANTYAYVNGNPVMYTDPSGLVRQLDPNGAECQQLKRKIQNKKADINKRICEVKTNPGNLPYYPPYLGARPRLSVQGHEDIIQELKDGLADDERLYAEKCGGDGGGTATAPVTSATSDNTAAKVAGAATGAGIAYWIISEGLRVIFPPRNLIPVP